MLPSMWTQPWLFRMQRYSQIPVITAMPAFPPSWTSQYFSQSVSRGLESQQFGVGLSLSNLGIFNFACTAELCHSKKEGWGFGSAAFDMWQYMGMVEWKREETSSVLLVVSAAAGGVERMEIVDVPVCLKDRKLFISSHSRRLWFTQWFWLLQTPLPQPCLQPNSVPCPAAHTEQLANNCVLNYRLSMLLERRSGALMRYSSSPSCAKEVPHT